MARKTPTLEIYDNEVDFFHKGKYSQNYVTVGREGDKQWFEWLQSPSNRSVRVESIHSNFTLRKELRSGIAYWYAYKKINKKLHNRYVGESLTVTPNKLLDVAHYFWRVKAIPEVPPPPEQETAKSKPDREKPGQISTDPEVVMATIAKLELDGRTNEAAGVRMFFQGEPGITEAGIQRHKDHIRRKD